MKVESSELVGLIRKNMKMLEKLHSSMEKVYREDLELLGKTDRSALMVAGILENYYTCLETVFFRISQYFENNLAPHQWHRDLLDKMTINIEGVRIAVVSEENYLLLLELLKFRHFRRYYFELEYDWDRLEYLRKKFHEAHPRVTEDLERFIGFLKAI
jgi:hypothetical protein